MQSASHQRFGRQFIGNIRNLNLETKFLRAFAVNAYITWLSVFCPSANRIGSFDFAQSVDGRVAAIAVARNTRRFRGMQYPFGQSNT